MNNVRREEHRDSARTVFSKNVLTEMLAVFNKEVLGAVGSVHCNHSTEDPEVGELP